MRFIPKNALRLGEVSSFSTRLSTQNARRFADGLYLTAESRSKILTGPWDFSFKLLAPGKPMTSEEAIVWAQTMGGIGILPAHTYPTFTEGRYSFELLGPEFEIIMAGTSFHSEKNGEYLWTPYVQNHGHAVEDRPDFEVVKDTHILVDRVSGREGSFSIQMAMKCHLPREAHPADAIYPVMLSQQRRRAM